jgi:DUF1365 family protein
MTSAGETSALYVGRVIHRRYRPRGHKLAYRVFWLHLDLDEVDGVARRLKSFSRNRFNLFSFHDRDYGDRSGRPIKEQIEAYLAGAGIGAGGRITLLTMPRILGYVFNPLSVFFCHKPDGSLAAIFYEVTNTFGERHSYLIPVSDSDAHPIRQSVEKCFFVSPFLDMDMAYDFRIEPPAEEVVVGIAARDAKGPMLNAVLRGSREALTDGALLSAFVRLPLLTLKVVAGIHWEALFLVAKRIGLRKKPQPPVHPVSLGVGHASKQVPEKCHTVFRPEPALK